MGCADKPLTQIHVTKVPERIVAHRKSQCGVCMFNESGVCERQKEKTPEKPCLIEVGVTIPKAQCPLSPPAWPKYEPVTISRSSCGNCRRQTEEVDDRGICVWCRARQTVRSRNASSRQSHRNIPAISRDDARDQLAIASPVRHLHYFIYPRRAASVEMNLALLRRHRDVFNGDLMCCVATDESTLQEQYRDELEDIFTEIEYRENVPHRRELVGFIPTLEKLYTKDPNHMICFAHAKGQQENTSIDSVVRKWTAAMYETVVGNWEQAADAFRSGYPLAGSFKSYGGFVGTRYKWHYSGTFFWGHAVKLFSNPAWRQTCSRWWGSESYVGRHFSRDDGYCLFGDRIDPGSLYKEHTWKQRLDKELETWRTGAAVEIA